MSKQYAIQKRFDLLPAGRLQHRLIFQLKTKTDDSFGSESVETWTDSFTVWGCYEPANSKEFPGFLKRNTEATARFLIRYRDDIDPDAHRIKFAMNPGAPSPNWQYFNLYPPIPEGGKRFSLTIEASEVK